MLDELPEVEWSIFDISSAPGLSWYGTTYYARRPDVVVAAIRAAIEARLR
jgi:hypothetical protein